MRVKTYAVVEDTLTVFYAVLRKPGKLFVQIPLRMAQDSHEWVEANKSALYKQLRKRFPESTLQVEWVEFADGSVGFVGVEDE